MLLNVLGTNSTPSFRFSSGTLGVGVEEPAGPTFKTTWNTEETGTSNNQQITLPLRAAGTYNFNVQWGDGQSDNITTYNDPAATHTYNSPGNYTVCITGTITGWVFRNGGDCKKLTTVEEWGPLRPGNEYGQFSGSYFSSNAADTLNLAGTTNAVDMFSYCPNFTTDANIGSWDMSSVTNMRYMFKGSASFNGAVGGWDVSKVTDMRSMFSDATSFNQDLSSWNTYKVTQLDSMFYQATAFNRDLTTWNTQNVTSASSMFQNATSFNGAVSLNLHKVTGTYLMFSGTTSFNNNVTLNTVNATLMGSMFQSCTSLNHAPTLNTSKVTNMVGMFQNCSALNVDLTFDTANVTNMSYALKGASSFNGDITSWNTHNVTNMWQVFHSCAAFNRDISSWNTNNTANMNSMFAYTGNVFNQDLSGWDIGSLTDASNMFLSAGGFSTANYDALLVAWNGQAHNDGVNFHAGSSKYTANSAASAAHDDFTANHSWTITDGGTV